MEDEILSPEIQSYIREKAEGNQSIAIIALEKSPFLEVTSKQVAQQVNALRKIKHKVPLWYDIPGIFYPPQLNLEQASSELTARYKSKIISGELLIDITGGLGVDTYFLSKKIRKVYHCELHKQLSEIARHNFQKLGANNIKTFAQNGLEVLEKIPKMDWIYVDPARRDHLNKKMIALNSYTPDITKHLAFLLQKAQNLLLKTSPLLDITEGLKSLKTTKEIHIVAVKNEVKELLWIMNSKTENYPKIKTVNMNGQKEDVFEFLWKRNESQVSSFSQPLKYLYEPNAAVLKSGGFVELGTSLKINKLHKHSHLYTSENLVQFPGRVFKVEKVIKFEKRILKKLGVDQANITTRNFPIPVNEIRQKLKIKEGGILYLFFTTDLTDQKIIVFCKKN